MIKRNTVMLRKSMWLMDLLSIISNQTIFSINARSVHNLFHTIPKKHQLNTRQWPSCQTLVTCIIRNKTKRLWFQSFGDIITREWLQNLTFTQHSWSIGSEGSLACQTYCDMRQSTKRPVDVLLAGELSVLTTYVISGWDSNTQLSSCVSNALPPTTQHKENKSKCSMFNFTKL